MSSARKGAPPLLRKSHGLIALLARTIRGYATPTFLPRVRRYAFVGLAVSLCNSLAIIASVHFVDPTVASVIAFIITLPIGYLAHRGVTFSDSKHDALQPLRFCVTAATSFVLAVGGMYWITEVAGHDYLLGIAWTWFIIPATNFVIYLLWVFRAAPTVTCHSPFRCSHTVRASISTVPRSRTCGELPMQPAASSPVPAGHGREKDRHRELVTSLAWMVLMWTRGGSK